MARRRAGAWPASRRSIGTILLLLGHRLEAEGVLGGTLHYVYGYLPLLLFVFAHVVARAGDARAVGIDRPGPAVGAVRLGVVHQLRAHAPGAMTGLGL